MNNELVETAATSTRSSRDNVYINIETRTFYIHDNIDRSSIGFVCYNLLRLLADDQKNEDSKKDYERKPIKIYINSYGGFVDDMWALVDIMTHSKSPIHTFSTSHADSCGFMIFIAGKKRIITKHTKMTCHQPSAGTHGTYQEIKECVQELDRMYLVYEDFVSEQTKITRKRLKEVREKKLDWVIYPEDSITLGVATDFIKEF